MKIITLRRSIGLLLLPVVLITGCERGTVLEEIREDGRLVVLTRNAPTTYYEDRDGETGFEYELTQALARALGVKAEYRIFDTIGEILSAVEAGEGHLAAAGLTRTEGREKRFNFGPDYRTVQQQVVCRRNGRVPKQVEHLTGVSLEIIASSSYAERLEELRQTLPELRWRASRDLDTEQILERVAERQVDCAVADSNIVAINRRYYPNLVVAFPLTEEQPLAWILPDGAPKLRAYLEKWFRKIEAEGLLAELNERFYGHVEVFDFVDLRAFRRRMDTRLPKYRSLFEEAGSRHGIAWTLLAAQAYQESHWNPKSRSPTGVRGIMMLTRKTASEVGVKDRLSARQSIMGGAKYLARLIKRISEEVTGSDRMWFALAAYNVGLGHLRDARTLAVRLEKNPDVWVDLREVLPLLSKKKYYRKLKHGYARGTEPVRYVQRIRDYHDIIEQRFLVAQATPRVPGKQ